MTESENTPVLVVDDDTISTEILHECLTGFGYEVTTATDGQQAIEFIRSGRFRLVVSDWEMPGLDGLDLCRYVRRRQACGYIYIILLTSRTGTQHVVRGLKSGADDFISKPFQPEELTVRLRTAERILTLESRDLLIFSMAKLAESRDNDTGSHLDRIRQYSRLLCNQLSEIDKYRNTVDGEYSQLIYLTSPLHDIGKVGIPDDILKKPGKLTEAEFEVMKTHTVIGGETLDAVSEMRPEAAFLKMARDIAWSHHEKYDGSGYPHGLAGDEIPLAARIVCLADVYDALTSKRVYKDAFSHEKARRIILESAAQHFDPDIVEAFLATEQAFIETRHILQEYPTSAGILQATSS